MTISRQFFWNALTTEGIGRIYYVLAGIPRDHVPVWRAVEPTRACIHDG